MSNPEPEQWWGTAKVAEMFDVHRDTIVDWIQAGLLPASKINGRWKVRRTDVLEFAKVRFDA